MSLIKQRIRKNGKHVGIMIAYKDSCGIHIGWSICKMSVDRYDRALAERIAESRAVNGSKVQPPRFAVQQLADFTARAAKYFNNPNPAVRVKKVKQTA